VTEHEGLLSGQLLGALGIARAAAALRRWHESERIEAGLIDAMSRNIGHGTSSQRLITLITCLSILTSGNVSNAGRTGFIDFLKRIRLRAPGVVSAIQGFTKVPELSRIAAPASGPGRTAPQPDWRQTR